MSTYCCSAASKVISRTQRLTVTRCSTCGTLWGDHVAATTGRYWDESYIPDDFAAALRARRITQAGLVLTALSSSGATEPVLDYGTGQGAFLSAALASGLDAFGCDLDLGAPLTLAPADADRVLQLNGPWQMPDGRAWGTVVMLDVLEHNPDPVTFMQNLGCGFLVLKLPTATGPAIRLARLAARFGHPALLEQLFLVGENFPHRWLATRKGVTRIATRSGWQVSSHRKLVEVGTELPARMRAASSMAPARWFLFVAGAGLAAIARFWSDTDLTVLTRSKNV